MEIDTILYLYAIWHAIIFDSFCSNLHTVNANFEMFDEVVHLLISFFVHSAYAHTDIK